MLKKLLIVPALAIGVVAVMLMVKGKDGPTEKPPAEHATVVRTLAVPKTDVVPRAIGYGEARAGRVWQAVPQVGGRIVELSPKVKEGSFARKNDVLVRIDDADYQLDVEVAEARITALQAQLKETETREATTRASLEIERDSLALAQAELLRLQTLGKDGTVTQSEVDREDRTVLTQRLRVQEIENSMTLLDPQRKVLKAQIAQETSNLERAKLNVQRTVIRAPFHCRMGPVKVEQDQVVQAGQVLFQADGTDTSEVTAWLPLQGVRRILAPSTAPIDAITESDDMVEKFGLRARIRIGAGSRQLAWEGKVVRVRGIDSQTRSLGLDVAVEDPYRSVVPGHRPPLVPGMYVEVEIFAPTRPGQVVVPRSAIHDDVVYLADADRRLRRRPITVAFVQEEIAVVKDGLEGGETLILTDIVPAVEGELLDPTPDDAARQVLLDDASGESPDR